MSKAPDSGFEIIRPPRFESEAQQALIDMSEAELQAYFKRAGRDVQPASSSDAGTFYDDTNLPAKLSEANAMEGAVAADPTAPAPSSVSEKKPTTPLSALGTTTLNDAWQDPLRRKLERTVLVMIPYTSAGQVAVPRRPYNQNATFIGAGNIAFELGYDVSFPAGSTVTLPGDRNYCFQVPAGVEVWMRSSVVVGALAVIIEPLIGECS